MRPVRRKLGAAAALALVIGVTATTTSGAAPPVTDSTLARDFTTVNRNTVWNQVDKLKLDFPTHHPQGLVVTRDHIFLSSVEIIEPTVKYPAPVDGYDRTPGKGVGHLFVMNRRGELQKDITLGEGDMYHPGGISFDGSNIWVPVGQYRPDSSAIIYKVDAGSLRVAEQFRVQDHIGGVVLDETTGNLVGNSWGSRRFYEWTPQGTTLSRWANPSHFVDYQDCQYVASAKAICSGIANLPQTPAAGGTSARYELGGLALIDLRTHQVLHEVPFQRWSTAGHVMTRNPVKLSSDGEQLTMWAAPDDGGEGNGTELFTFRAAVPGS